MARVAVPAGIPWGFAEVFIISQTALPALLYLPGSQAFRLPIRFSAFAISLAAFAWYQVESTTQAPRSKMQPWVAAIMALLAVMLFHPETTSLVGGIAHMAVYFSVLAPLFWAPEFVKSPEQLARLLWLLLFCSGANAVVGVLQVYDPARWLPAEFSRIVTSNRTPSARSRYIGAHGAADRPAAGTVRHARRRRRPGDVRGAARAGLRGQRHSDVAARDFARGRGRGVRGHLSEPGSRQPRRHRRDDGDLLPGVRCARGARRAARSSAFSRAASWSRACRSRSRWAGTGISDRVNSLFVSDPFSVYQGARGSQLSYTFFDLLFQYPLGAGLGRWGMAAGYFGSNNSNSPGIWAEIQFTGWMIDGGALMVAIYVGSLLIDDAQSVADCAGDAVSAPRVCGAVILAAGLGPFLMIVSFTPFVAQIGIRYWFLAGALHGVASRHGVQSRRMTRVGPGDRGLHAARRDGSRESRARALPGDVRT